MFSPNAWRIARACQVEPPSCFVDPTDDWVDRKYPDRPSIMGNATGLSQARREDKNENGSAEMDGPALVWLNGPGDEFSS